MAITTSSSISVNPRRDRPAARGKYEAILPLLSDRLNGSAERSGFYRRDLDGQEKSSAVSQLAGMSHG
jgi:hypothetical protein